MTPVTNKKITKTKTFKFEMCQLSIMTMKQTQSCQFQVIVIYRAPRNVVASFSIGPARSTLFYRDLFYAWQRRYLN
jgi:hypothetical protein